MTASGAQGGGETVEIASLAAGGAGVTRLADGMIAFVPRTAPGDRVRLAHVRRHKRHAEARVAVLVEPGPGRVEPVCRHFVRDHCGGCQWQHLGPEVQTAAKRRIVGDALRRIGRLEVPDPDLFPSPRAIGYRTTVTLTVRRVGRSVVAGFHDERDPDVVFPLERCLIARPELQALWDALAPALGGLPDGDDVRLRLRLATDGSLHAVVSGGARAWTDASPLAVAARRAGLEVTLWWHPAGGAARRLAGPEADPASVAFGQVNAEVADALRRAVVDAVVDGRAGAAARVLDLYAGAGDTARALAALGHDVTMVELDRPSLRRAEALAVQAGIRLRAIGGRVEDHLTGLLPADVVVVNPPRTGLAESVATALGPRATGGGRAAAMRLVYVSCDPATLGRDLRRLGVSATDLRLVRAWDMFPQTSHVETLVVADLRPEAGAAKTGD